MPPTPARPDLEVVDLRRGDRHLTLALATVTTPAEALAVSTRLIARTGARRFVGVLSADVGAALAGVVHALQPGLAEVVCFDSLGSPEVAGLDLAFRALDELGLGEDFVYTVPILEDAIEHAIDAVLTADQTGWEGETVLVLGTSDVVGRARRHATGS